MKKSNIDKVLQRAEDFKKAVKDLSFEKTDNPIKKTLEFRWSTSKGRDSYGYNICALFVDGVKVAACNGGGYDMKGTSLGNWLQIAYEKRLYKLIKKEFYGLSFHNPLFNVMDEKLEKSDGTFTDKTDEGKTFRELKEAGKLVDLEINRAFYKSSSKVPTKDHIYGILDGASGFSSMESVATVLGLTLEYVPTKGKSSSIYILRDFKKEVVK